jgi:hypothetical protein
MSDSWFTIPARTKRVFKATPGGDVDVGDETYYDVGDIAGLISVAVAGSIMIVMFSGAAAYKQYLSEMSN